MSMPTMSEMKLRHAINEYNKTFEVFNTITTFDYETEKFYIIEFIKYVYGDDDISDILFTKNCLHDKIVEFEHINKFNSEVEKTKFWWD